VEVSFWVDILAYSRPVPYDCVVKPRFPDVESILAEERERFGILKSSSLLDLQSIRRLFIQRHAHQGMNWMMAHCIYKSSELYGSEDYYRDFDRSWVGLDIWTGSLTLQQMTA
jgi:hypothetical protein